MLACLGGVAAVGRQPAAGCSTSYTATAKVDPRPVLSALMGNSAFGQVFNPSWVEASPDGTVKPGLLVRTQNCTLGWAEPGCGLANPTDPKAHHSCCGCNMRSSNDSTQKRSILTWCA